MHAYVYAILNTKLLLDLFFVKAKDWGGFAAEACQTLVLVAIGVTAYGLTVLSYQANCSL
jgi:hypothetical protein